MMKLFQNPAFLISSRSDRGAPTASSLRHDIS